MKDRIILAKKAYSDHPDDSYLEVHLAVVPHPGSELKPIEFVTWGFNKHVGHFEGHYFEGTQEGFERAVKDFNERGVKSGTKLVVI
jgi:hypothetical protein